MRRRYLCGLKSLRLTEVRVKIEQVGIVAGRPAGGLAQLPPRLEFKKPPTRGRREGGKSMRFRCRYAYTSVYVPGCETWPNLDDDVTPRQNE